jgi:hypothetical protein
MTSAELEELERHIGARLPEDLRNLYLHYPFAEGSWAADLAMPDDVDYLIEVNQDRSFPGEFCASDPTRYIYIGNDGGETENYATLGEEPTRIFEADIETGSFSEVAGSLEEWKAQMYAIDQEIERDKAYMSRKRWWQFWK